MASSTERDHSRDEERYLRHQHSASSASSDHARALIPMWDSSDPERAPPPLPLHPQSPSVSPRKGTSSAIQSAHANLVERARESNSCAGSMVKRQGDMSPDKSLVKSHHRRMQSLQTGTVRDLSMLLENGRPHSPQSPTKSSDKAARPSTPARILEAVESRPAERELPTPVPGPSLTPIVRPTVRRPQQSILGENTPPQSATMLALQNNATQAPRELPETPPPAHATKASDALVKSVPNIDGLSDQILSLTSIATALQKDIAQLSRRSRDNATDLLSLKEATNARDEDIRRSLREVITNFHDGLPSSSRGTSNSGLFIDSKPYLQHGSSPVPSAARPFSLPRIPSPNSFAANIDREALGTPSVYPTDSQKSIAIMEQILNDMGTKQGHELLLSRLTQISELITGLASTAKVEELIAITKKASEQAVVPHTTAGSGQEAEASPKGAMTQRGETLLRNENGRRSSPSGTAASDFMNEEFLKIIRSMKDSVSQSGGMTAEVKALVRELRGEVLGMGRELGRRLEQAKNHEQEHMNKAESSGEMARIVEEGLEEMRDQMKEVVQAYHRQSTALTSLPSKEVDYQEIYNAVRAAIRDSHASDATRSNEPDLSKEDVLEAVRTAWEEYKPEVEVVDHGLGKEEVLEYLKEGLQTYNEADERMPGATREEVFQAVVEGLKHFVPPRMDSAASLSRDEILDAVRECLEEFEFPVAPSAINAELTRDDMVHAVQEGLAGFEFPQHSNQQAITTGSNDITARLEELMTFMQREFSIVSEEAKQNMAANGRDTEQVLDATKDGLDKLRLDLEDFIHEATTQSSSKDDSGLLEVMSTSLDSFREDIAGLLAKSAEDSRIAMASKLDTLHDTVNSSMVPVTPQTSHTEILEAMKTGLDSLRAEMHRPLAGTTEVLDALHEGLSDLRISIEKVGNKPIDFTANDEILDALKTGLDSVRSEIDGLRVEKRDVNAVTTMHDNAMVPAEQQEMLRQDDIKNLEVLITQLRIKVEAIAPEMDQARSNSSVSKEDLGRLEDMLSHITESVSSIGREQSTPRAATEAAAREDVEAIETILRNTKSRLDDLIDGDQAVRKEHVDSLQATLEETRSAMDGVNSQLDDLPRKAELATIETAMAQISIAFEDMREATTKGLEDPERITKSSVESIETICHEIRAVLDETIKADLATLASGEDVQAISTNLEGLKEHFDTAAQANIASFEERQAEIVGVGECVSDVKTVLQEFQEDARTKFEDGAASIEALGKMLETVSGILNQNATVGQDLKDFSESMMAEFEESKASMVGAKLDADEKLQQAAEGLGIKIDEKVTELLARYDESQTAAEERAKAGEARNLESEQIIMGAKSVADEVKTSVDTLGSAVTDSLDKMEEASKTVFDKVEELTNRAEENHLDGKSEHQQTRDQVKLAIDAVEGLQGQIGENQPKILEAIKDVLAVVGQHYEHSKTSATEIEEKLLTTQMKAEPPLLPPPEKYDDTSMHEKLDKLMGHNLVAEKAFNQLDTLDKVHQQVMQTASEISSFLSDQAKQITENSEDRERALQETTLALERQKIQKEQVETNLVSLREEEQALKESVLRMKNEQEAMARQKTKLTADVSSLETALRLRREELQDMEARAEGLERRILEGVMDHSRVLLMSKAAKNQETMSRKRVGAQKPSRAAEPTIHGQPSRPSVPITLSAKRSLAPPSQNQTARRILSLSQINNNTVASGVKRSQSVRTPAARTLRKSSWAAGHDRDGKENVSVHGIDEEPESEGLNHQVSLNPLSVIEGSAIDEDGNSELDDLRRSSHGTTIITDSAFDGIGSDDDRATDSDSREGEDGIEPKGNEVVVFGEPAVV